MSLPQIFQYNGAVFTLHVGLSWVGLFGRREGGVVALVRGAEGKQRRTRKSGNTEGKASILEMGQHKSLAFKFYATSHALVFRSGCMGF